MICFILTTSINQMLHFEARTLIIPEFHQILRRHPDLNQGPLHLQSNALILSHTPCSQTHRTKARKLHTWFWQHQIKTEVRNSSFLLSTIGKGGTRIWTGDLLICSQMLYHWAIPPIHPVKKQNKINYILHWKKSSSFPSRSGFWLSQNSIQSKRGTRIWTGKLFMCSQMLYYWAIPHAPKTKARKLHTSFWQHQQPHFECSKYSKSKGGSWIWTCKSLDLPWFEVKTLSQEFAYFILTTSNNNSFTSKSGLWFFQNPPKSKVKKWGPLFLKILSSSTEKKSVWQKINNNSLVLKLIFPKFATQQGAPGFEPGTSWSAVKCSTTELYPHEIEIIT